MVDSSTQAKCAFNKFEFEHDSYKHEVFWRGDGRPIVLLHELPGFAESTIDFVDRLVAANFSVYAPLLFGMLGKRNAIDNYAKLCVSKEFEYLKSGKSAPVCDWLRGLLRHVSVLRNSSKVGAIGMCVTGAFIVPMILEEKLGAACISQPAIPFSVSYLLTGMGSGDWMRELNVSDNDITNAAVHANSAAIPILLQRFNDDRLCPHARLKRLLHEFGPVAEMVEYPKPNPSTISPHALMTDEFEDAPNDPENSTRIALKRVIEFFDKNL
uniref:dienelactone hydrolase family protein n=1 Tax=Cupriavidus yeoncheonensis TaxID=1462994 RepID=UPI003F4974F9